MKILIIHKNVYLPLWAILLENIKQARWFIFGLPFLIQRFLSFFSCFITIDTGLALSFTPFIFAHLINVHE
ncbi:hypothetical protein NC651_003212 [Populus alba x Populus x berolinensis]|nr:hypothetical protein NC651_003212 [Populus alba x Populus x berolinensis]